MLAYWLPGDFALIYHTGREKAIVGVARVVSGPHPDPGSPDLPVIDVEPGYRLGRPVSLAEIKGGPSFDGWGLVRLPRLSVMPVPPEHWLKIHAMADGQQTR